MDTPRFRSLDQSETLRLLVRNLPAGVYVSTEAGEILDANPAFLRLFGFASIAQARAWRVPDLLEDPSSRLEELELLERTGAVRQFELRIRRMDGTVRTVLDTCYLVRDPVAGDVLLHGILVDISGRKELEEQLRELSTRDPLTGCFNRRHLADLSRELEAEGADWGTIVLDVDRFKEVNDRYGHQAGDEILVELSRFLLRQVRPRDAVVRMGGDEFLVLLTREGAASTAQIAERFRSQDEEPAPIEFSLGWAVRHPGETVERTISRADRELLEVRARMRPSERRSGSHRLPPR